MKPLRIAVITRTYPPKGGGIAAAHFNLTQCLKEFHDVRVFVYDDDDAEPIEGVTRRKTSHRMKSLMTFLARMWVRKYAKGEQATDCERIFGIIPAIRSINRELKRFEPDFILCPDNYVPAIGLRKPDGSKLLWIAHHNYRRFGANPLAGEHSWIDLQLAHRLELRGTQKADAFIAVSDYIAEVTKTTLNPERPVHVIRNFVDTEQIKKLTPSDLRTRLKLNDDQTVIYLPSAGTPVKGERFTFEIIRRLGQHGAAFFLSGRLSPSLAFELKHLSKDIPIYTPGQQTYLENLSDVTACDFAVSPTLIENLSSALIEALACGLPVISFDVGGNREIISTNTNGFLVPYLDIEALIERSASLIQDRNLLCEFRSNAKSSISKLLNPDRVLSEYNSVFASLAN